MSPIQALVERHVSKLPCEPGCWLWTGAVSEATGYGVAGVPGTHKTMGAHRASYLAHIGPIPPGLELDHLCRVRSCVNPAHLEPVTPQVNKLRAAGVRTECRYGHPLDGRMTRGDGRSTRYCKTCNRMNAASRYVPRASR